MRRDLDACSLRVGLTVLNIPLVEMLLFVPVRETEEHTGPCLRFLERTSHVASTAELSTVFATEDHVTLEGTWRRTDASPLSLPEASLPVRGHAGGVLVCIVLQIRHGKIVSLHCYCDLTTLLEQLGFNAATAQAM